MRAVHLHEHGGPEALRIVDVPVPEPGPGEVLVRVAAVSLNHLDVWVRRGMPGVEMALPHVPGCDGTGVVDGARDGRDSVSVGQEVVLEPGYTEADGPEVEAGLDHLAPDYRIRGEHGPGFAAEYAVPAGALRDGDPRGRGHRPRRCRSAGLPHRLGHGPHAGGAEGR